jgi:hypothetical protein
LSGARRRFHQFLHFNCRKVARLPCGGAAAVLTVSGRVLVAAPPRPNCFRGASLQVHFLTLTTNGGQRIFHYAALILNSRQVRRKSIFRTVTVPRGGRMASE